MALLLRRTPQFLRLRYQYRCVSSSKPTPQEAARHASAARDVARQRRTAAEQVDRQAKEQADKDYKKRYDTAARKWVSSIIAIPIMLVTSYYLFDRLVLKNEPKKWERNRDKLGKDKDKE